ncbi:MAG: acetyl-CoA carboxylase biotin carboxylase subunit [Desulfotignum sp.]|nr:acetyl-CoA carboxylase biotin carboxylase subunit [Desulfotignum sp.]
MKLKEMIKMKFNSVLIANRGEIALRIMRACRFLGLKTIAVYSEADKQLAHVQMADTALCIGPPNPGDSYLSRDSILVAAKLTGAQAVHPGYGFLSEDSLFSQAVQGAGLTFVGPSADAIDRIGDKIRAKQVMAKAGVPCVPGSEDMIPDDIGECKKIADQVGFPLMIKAVSGGGGRGMRIVRQPKDLVNAILVTRQEAANAFGRSDVYMERFLEHPRHIEIQVLADTFGNAIWLGARDCSMQRRHQKLIEETPPPHIPQDLIATLGEQCANACKKINYIGAGTFEFLYEDGQFYFIEMNTRLQVEHPVTEMVTGIDIVVEQLTIAQGDPLSVTQEEIRPTGHAIECRINAEHPWKFLPSPGRIKKWYSPGGPGVRVDSHLYENYNIPPNYDSLIAKLITLGSDRNDALNRMKAALNEMQIEGIDTTIALQKALIQDPDFQKGGIDIHYLDHWLENKRNRP